MSSDFLTVMMAFNAKMLLTLFILLFIDGPKIIHSWDSVCEPIQIETCQGLGYELTTMPNLLGHESQAQANRELNLLLLRITHECSPHLRLFLCSMFVPLCSEQVSAPVPACRSLCEEVQSSCSLLLLSLKRPWHPFFNCSQFPEPKRNGPCMQFPNASEDATAPDTSVTVHGRPTRRHNWLQGERNPNPLLTPNESQCPPNFAKARDLSSVTCSPQCGKDAYFSSRDKTFAAAWMSGWAWLCFISTLFTLLTFWVEPSRFRYPERPVVFLALCYNIISLAFIVRGILGAEKISCLHTDEDSYVVTEGLESAPCTLIFLILYYFSMASAVWWLVLTIAWFLSAAKKWSSEALHGLASFFHTAAWGGPAIAAGAVLAMRKVAGDELTGLCFVAEPAVLGFVVLPHALLLLVGAALAAAGGTALVQVRQAMRCAGRDTAKLERLMTRLGVFAALYVIPALGALVCWMYEAANRPRWKSRAHLAALDCRIGLDRGCVQPVESSGGVEVALLRVFLSLVVGVTSGMWVWSSKTCKAWGSIFSPRKHQKIYTTPAKVAVINLGVARNAPISKV
ncbi:hypothetical protein B566_EDAN007823 [Ephemera danica]|nr:hypothetical protein B566_EDAN007823 [Ephemera danica]